MIAALASHSVGLGSIPLFSHAKDLEVFTASLSDAKPERNSKEERLASSLVVLLGKIFNGIPSSLCGRQMVGSNSLPIAETSLTKNLQTKHELIRMIVISGLINC